MAASRRVFMAGVVSTGALAPGMGKAEMNAATVHAPAGSMTGRVKDDVRLFTGVPFGASTASAGRFRPPRPVEAWKGMFNATRTANVAPQATSPLFPRLPGTASEDCLHLNVWAPMTPGPHPVLVWLHGGNNIEGSCVEPIFDCRVFARDGLVAINFNYRLGALGFLELGGVLGPEYRGSANNALRDQLLALQWVKRNVAAFGGDPARITVAGESAGAFDLCALLAAPASKGLFSRAIVASGGQAVHDVATADAFAKVFVDQLGGADRLRTAATDEIVTAQAKAAAAWPHALPYRGVIDPKTMPLAPIQAVSAGSARDVDLMIGWCRDETRMMVPAAAAANPGFRPPTVWLDAAKMPGIMAGYAKAFPRSSQAEVVWKATTAEAFGVTSARIADAQAAAGGRVRRYRLDYTVPGGPFGNMTPHGFDVPMVFEQMDSPLARLFGFSAADAAMEKTLHGVWSSFARTGSVKAGLPPWPFYKPSDPQVMLLDRTSRATDSADQMDRDIWAGA